MVKFGWLSGRNFNEFWSKNYPLLALKFTPKFGDIYGKAYCVGKG